MKEKFKKIGIWNLVFAFIGAVFGILFYRFTTFPNAFPTVEFSFFDPAFFVLIPVSIFSIGVMVVGWFGLPIYTGIKMVQFKKNGKYLKFFLICNIAISVLMGCVCIIDASMENWFLFGMGLADVCCAIVSIPALFYKK